MVAVFAVVHHKGASCSKSCTDLIQSRAEKGEKDLYFPYISFNKNKKIVILNGTKRLQLFNTKYSLILILSTY